MVLGLSHRTIAFHPPWFVERPSRPRRSVRTRLARTWRTSWWVFFHWRLGIPSSQSREIPWISNLKPLEIPLWSLERKNMQWTNYQHAVSYIWSSSFVMPFYSFVAGFACWILPLIHLSHVLNVLHPGTKWGNAYAIAYVLLMHAPVLLTHISCLARSYTHHSTPHPYKGFFFLKMNRKVFCTWLILS